MPSTRVKALAASDEEVTAILALAAASDSVELKLTVPESEQRSAMTALGLDPITAEIRQVYFFETPDLALDRAGVVVRARRCAGRAHDTVIKLRPVVPDTLRADLRRSPNLGVEVDAMPGGHVCSASMKGTLGKNDALEYIRGDKPLRKLFTKEQREFYAQHVPEGIGLDDLTVLGPIFVLKGKAIPPGSSRRLVAEVWLYPDDSRILELSTKCAPNEVFQVAAEGRALLTGLGITLTGEQQTKTRKALEFFSARLAQV
jgi:hypothetical protein